MRAPLAYVSVRLCLWVPLPLFPFPLPPPLFPATHPPKQDPHAGRGRLLFASTQRPRRPSFPTCARAAPLLTLTCDVDVAVRCSMSNVLSTTLRNSNNAVHVPNLQDIITAPVGQSRGARREARRVNCEANLPDSSGGGRCMTRA